MFSNAKLRLLMTLVSFERLGMEDVPGASWVVPSALSSKDIEHTQTTIDQRLEKPIPEDQDPRELLRRKDNSRGDGPSVDVNFGSDSEGEDDLPDGYLFPPNPRSKSNALDELKKKRKKKQNQDDEKESVDEATFEERRKTRLENARAHHAKIKSELYIHASDEESNDEDDQQFFRLEEQRRKDQAERVKKALLTRDLSDKPGKKSGGRKRKSDGAEAQKKRQRRPQSSNNDGSDDDNDDDILMMGVNTGSPASPRETAVGEDNKVNEDVRPTPIDDYLDFDDDLAFNRNRERSGSANDNDASASKTAGAAAGDGDEAEDEDARPAPGRRRMRAGFVVESDSE